jgi:hypothetical protein
MRRIVCQKETEGKGQVATNNDEDDHDDHVVSREICTRSSKCSRYFLLATILVFLLSSKYIYIYELIPLIISFMPSSFYFSYQHLSSFFLYTQSSLLYYVVSKLYVILSAHTHARIIDIDKKKDSCVIASVFLYIIKTGNR